MFSVSHNRNGQNMIKKQNYIKKMAVSILDSNVLSKFLSISNSFMIKKQVEQ